MTDSEEPVLPEDRGWGSPGATVTLPPAGQAGPPYGYQGYTWGAPPPPPPPPAPPTGPGRGRAAGNLTALVAALAMMLVAFFGATRLHNATTTTTAPSNGSPFGGRGGFQTPFTGNGSAGDTSSGTSTLSSSEVSSIASKVDNGVVDIDTELGYENGRAAGTGMVLTPSGEVLTNNHVVAGSTKITATVVTTGKTYTAKVVGTDPTDDVAIIQLDGASGLKTITPGKSSSVSVGDPVVAVGNAGGKGGTPAVATGTVTALGQTITASDENGTNAQQLSDLIEVDAPIESGDSGGPLANKAGEVIGMDSAAEVSGPRYRATSNLGYAIQIDKALSIAQQIESGKASSTIHLGLPAFLGVQTAAPSQGQGRRGAAQAPSSDGATIVGVEPNTPADSIGLAAGDTITAINGQTVNSASALTTALQPHKPGDQVTVTWTDTSGTSHTAKATLTTGPAD